jgi:hypothetical protein
MEQKALQEQLFAAQKMKSIGAFAGGTAHISGTYFRQYP